MNALTNQEICEEIKAIRDLAERLADKMDELNLRLEQRGSGKTDYWNVPRKSRWISIDEDDEGGD